MMNIIQQVTDPMPTNLSYIVLTKLLMLLLLSILLQYHCHHCYRYYHITLLLITLLQILSLSGVVELTTQLLILVNILWAPLVLNQ